MMRPISQLGDPFSYGKHSGAFSAWTMAIVFATVALLSFAIDQTVTLSTSGAEQGEINSPSLLHPVELIQSLIEAASE
jgi:hypothetical protein